jgi:hypothetical protein
MASNTHGGYRQPANPAPVSGPGRMARRTDGGPGQQTTTPMTGMGYGENADFNDIQSAAPLAAAPTAPNARSRNKVPAGQSGAAAAPLFSPTQRPDEPVTAGAPVGPGPGPSAAAPGPRVKLADTLAALAPFDDSGEIARLLAVARRRGW